MAPFLLGAIVARRRCGVERTRRRGAATMGRDGGWVCSRCDGVCGGDYSGVCVVVEVWFGVDVETCVWGLVF